MQSRFYICKKCRHRFTERISAPYQLVFFANTKRQVVGTLCPTCKESVIDFLNVRDSDLDKKVVSDVLDRLEKATKKRSALGS